MSQPQVIGMMLDHREIDHLLTNISDSLRNAAYKVATERYPKGSAKHHDFFDEDGTLIGYDEDSNKALLKDALDHYVQFSNEHGQHLQSDFNYYLGDSFQLVEEHINKDPQLMSYLTAQFASACGTLAGALQPVVQDLGNHGQTIDKIESFTIDREKSYYVVFGENVDQPAGYDPKEDDLSSVVIDDTPEDLAAWEVKKQAQFELERIADEVWTDIQNKNKLVECARLPNTNTAVKQMIAWSELADEIKANPIENVSVKAIVPIPRHPHIDSNTYAKLNNWSAPGIELT